MTLPGLPNDLKLSDGRGWRAGCLVGGKAELERRLQPILAGAAEIARCPAGGSPASGGIDRTATLESEH